jgi:hypothetical protein
VFSGSDFLLLFIAITNETFLSFEVVISHFKKIKGDQTGNIRMDQKSYKTMFRVMKLNKAFIHQRIGEEVYNGPEKGKTDDRLHKVKVRTLCNAVLT